MTDRRCPFPHSDASPETEECPVGHTSNQLRTESPQTWARKQVRTLLTPLLDVYESRTFRDVEPYDSELIRVADKLVQNLILEVRASTGSATIDGIREGYNTVCADLHLEASAQGLLPGYQKLLHHGRWGENLFGWLSHAIHVVCDVLPEQPLDSVTWKEYRKRVIWVSQWLAYFPLSLEGFAISEESLFSDGSEVAHPSIVPTLRSICEGKEVHQLSDAYRTMFSRWLPRTDLQRDNWPATRHGCPALRSRALVKLVDAICDDYERVVYWDAATLHNQ